MFRCQAHDPVRVGPRIQAQAEIGKGKQALVYCEAGHYVRLTGLSLNQAQAQVAVMVAGVLR